MDSDTQNMEYIADKLRSIDGIVLHFRAILNWEKPYHAVLLSSLITLVFMLFWLIDATIISKFCMVAIVVVALDFLLPVLNGFLSKKWIEENEQKFQEFCLIISKLSSNLKNFVDKYSQMKYTNTKTFYCTLLTGLLFVAWIGSLVHNLLLTYLLTLALALYPGLAKQEAFADYMSSMASRILSFLPRKPKKHD